MLDLPTRTAILGLKKKKHSIRWIAKHLKVSRKAVRNVVRSGEATVPESGHDALLTEHIEKVRELHVSCKGNLVRVHEELQAQGIEVGYSTVTAFCRRHELGVKPKKRAGRYHFEPGEEMQHDTSPHRVKVGEHQVRLECASVVLCYSRLRYIQCFHRWNRFYARVFLTEALQYFGGAAEQAMIDNSSVIVQRGTGKNALIAREMEAFSERYDFVFVAHEKGDANRSARVERPFHEVEHNFYAGRTFADLADLNQQLREWCDTKNSAYKRSLKASPRELFAVEATALTPLPSYIPEVYDLHTRRVGVEGYIHLHTNRYSVPEALIGRQVSVHEHRHTLRVFDGHKLLIEHDKQPDGLGKRVTLPQHRYKRKRKPEPILPEEVVLRAAHPVLGAFLDALRKRRGRQTTKAIRKLHRIFLDYPTDAVVEAVRTALDFGLLDLGRIERMVLRRIAGDFFRIPTSGGRHE